MSVAFVAPNATASSSADGGVCDSAVTVHAPMATPMFWYQTLFSYEPEIGTCSYACSSTTTSCTDGFGYGDFVKNPTQFAIVEPLGVAATTTVNVPNPTYWFKTTISGKQRASTYPVTTTLALPTQTAKDGMIFSDIV